MLRAGDEVASGRLILLHDPAGHDAWRGNLRLVTLVTAELESDMAGDPLLPAVAWTWLTDGAGSARAAYTAIGGTITQTTSTRFGELAGPAPTADLEIRASWTPDVGRPGRPPVRLVHHARLDRRPAAARRDRTVGPAPRQRGS